MSLDPSALDTVHEQLKIDEGFREKPYRCTAGKLTIGYGRNLDDRGIHWSEAERMLENDIHLAAQSLEQNFPWVPNLSSARQAVLVNMVFNLGISRFLQFKKMLAAVHAGEYEEAAKEMLDSRWANQVGDRAKRLAEEMRTG